MEMIKITEVLLRETHIYVTWKKSEHAFCRNLFLQLEQEQIKGRRQWLLLGGGGDRIAVIRSCKTDLWSIGTSFFGEVIL